MIWFYEEGMTMDCNYTRHAAKRARQRGIPMFVNDLLDQFGEDWFDGRGCVCTMISGKSVKRMQSTLGRGATRHLEQYRGVYRVESLRDGRDVTLGRRHRRVRRR